MPDVDAILAPVGGGGLLAGIALAARARGRTVRLIGVQAAGADAMAASLAARRRVPGPPGPPAGPARPAGRAAPAAGRAAGERGQHRASPGRLGAAGRPVRGPVAA